MKHRPQQIVVILMALLGITPLFPQQSPKTQIETLTPERILSQPSLNGELCRQLHWNSNGSRLAWLQSSPPAAPSPSRTPHPPSTEIWSIDGATAHRSLLVSAAQITAALGTTTSSRAGTDDDHPSEPPHLIDYAWASDGQSLLLIARSSLVWLDLASGRARTLVSGIEELGDATVSPDGRYVSFIRGHTLWLTETATGVTRRFTPPGSDDLYEGEPDWPYRNDLNLQSAYWWSPDSSQIAWLETDDRATGKYTLRSAEGRERTIVYPLPGSPPPVVRLFVQSLNGRQPRAIDLGSPAPAYIPRVTWTPDSHRLAVQRLDRAQKALDLFIADTATGKAHAILSEKDSYWINLNDDLHFLIDSKRFIWSSERSGYRHLYLYDIEGHQLAQLTSGDWEVTSVDAVDEAGGKVYFTSTRQDTPAFPGTERQVYRVGLDGSSLTAVTHEKGTHQAFFSPGAQLFVDTFSTSATPPRQDLIHADGVNLTAINENPVPSLAAYQLPPVEFLTVKMHMGSEINALMIRPPGFDPSRKYPAIVYIAGGPGEQIVRDAWGGDIFLWLRMMAQKGYLIYAQDGHGTAGRGHFFEEPLHLRLSSMEMADQRDGVRYLRSLPFVDPGRVGIYGWGYGGFLALHAMLDRPIAYKAGVAGAPVTDWRLYDAIFSERYLEDPVRNQDGYLDSMPTENAINLKGPLLIVQGMADEKVHIENSLVLLNEFLETAKYPSVMFLPDRGHVFADHEAQLALYRAMTDFFVKNL